MKIFVCVKQVPGSSEVEMDEEGNLIRDPSNVKINPYDLFAIESSLQIKETMVSNPEAVSISIFSMGPPAATQVIREAFMMGADAGYLLSDRKFAGADVWATAYAIAQGIKKVGVPDLIICGKQTTDGDTAQVGSEMAEFLEIPHITNVTKIHSLDEKSITVDADLPDYVQTARMPFPCLITVEKDIFTPRLPSYRRKLKTKDLKIPIITQAQLPDKSERNYGGKGSPTRVVKVFPPDKSSNKQEITGSPEEISNQIFAILKEMKVV